eukprot:TRINITY_DN5071_c0_g2_i3.p1 TRINITY_DN5071_c0_g2~~TRINITY_DN5071_c0_g2_i3.p1  ORF type:complete len:218 (-),score=-8.26 TRINITY_DN5071_c0_g2_i3:137-790(-)
MFFFFPFEREIISNFQQQIYVVKFLYVEIELVGQVNKYEQNGCKLIQFEFRSRKKRRKIYTYTIITIYKNIYIYISNSNQIGYFVISLQSLYFRQLVDICGNLSLFFKLETFLIAIILIQLREKYSLINVLVFCFFKLANCNINCHYEIVCQVDIDSSLYKILYEIYVCIFINYIFIQLYQKLYRKGRYAHITQKKKFFKIIYMHIFFKVNGIIVSC